MNNFKKNFYLSIVMSFLGMNLPVYGTTITLLEEQERPISQLLRLVHNLKMEDIDLLKTATTYTEGVKYRQGIEVKQDLDKAFEYIKLAADKGYPFAEYDLAVMYLYGSGRVTQSLQDSIAYYTKAFDHGSANAANDLGVMYELGNSLIPLNKEKAIYYYEKAFEKGYDLALTNLDRLLKE